MSNLVSHLPDWLRWTLFVPASLAGGFLAGYTIHLIGASQAENPTAPVISIAEFLAGIAMNLVAIHIEYIFAPSHKRMVVIVFVIIAVIASMAAIASILYNDDFDELWLVAGNLVACYIAWQKYIRTNDIHA